MGSHFERWKIGVQGPIVLSRLDEGMKYLSWQKWSYKVGLKGGSEALGWTPSLLENQKQRPLTRYKAYFDAPGGEDPLALDTSSMTKCHVWINDQNIGRYWKIPANGTWSDQCSYSGTYRETKCTFGCGLPTQQWHRKK